MPEEKRTRIYDAVFQLYNKNVSSIRNVAQIIGKLIAASPANKYGFLYTKILERENFLAFRDSYGNFDKMMNITENMKIDLRWWLEAVKKSKMPVRENKYVLEIFTDASKTDWSAYCKGEKARGWWETISQKQIINQLELVAAFNGLKCFAKDKNNCEILLRIDNTVAISYINRMGGIRFPKLNDIARKIWQWCESKNIYLFASYINTKDNYHADSESRALSPETEWELADWAFTLISKKFGTPEIDLFASNVNTKCKKFVSWKKDPDSMAVDAFTISWKKFLFYAFPPFTLILKVLQKIVIDKAEGIVVVPY